MGRRFQPLRSRPLIHHLRESSHEARVFHPPGSAEEAAQRPSRRACPEEPLGASRRAAWSAARLAALLVFVALLAAPLLPAAYAAGNGPPPWLAEYRAGVTAVGQGDGAAAAVALERALEAAPEPRLGVPLEAGRADGATVDYLPHLYMAAALHLQGRIEAAREALARSEAAGVAARSDRGRSLLDAYRVLLADGAPVPGEAVEGSLEASEVARLEARVARRCGLDLAAATGPLPWYFHYELGLQLAARQDPRRALRELAVALRLRPRPQRNSRLYGMWFEDYRPYFHIARLQLALGHRECALDALRASRWWEEVAPGDPEYDEYELIEKELADDP